MRALRVRLATVNWRFALMLACLATFALTGAVAADDGPGW